MKITSNVLGTFARALGLSTPGIQDTDLVIPGIFQPTLDVREPFDAVLSAGNVMRTSFATFTQQLVANGAISNNIVVTLTPGLWELSIDVCYSTNYATASNTGWNLNYQLAGGSAFLALELFTNAFPDTVVYKKDLKLSLARNLDILSKLYNNGVGNSHNVSVTMIGHKLL